MQPTETTMADATADWTAVLSAMSIALSSGDNPRGEELFCSALDLGAPWDVATQAAAHALSHRPTMQAASLEPLPA